MEETKTISTTIITALKAKGLTVEKLAQATGISDRFLESLVEERFEDLPPPPYVRGYLIKIAGVLGLDGEELWREYLSGNGSIKRAGGGDQLPRNRFASKGLNKKVILVGVVVLGIALYVIVKTPLFSGQPGFTLTNPTQDITVTQEPTFILSGTVSPAHTLTLNGERIYPDRNGSFEKEILLHAGFNTLVFSVKKLIGKEKVTHKQIFYKTEGESVSQDKNGGDQKTTGE